MATTERDYYDILGVGRAATEQEIKSAFRAVSYTHLTLPTTPYV